MPEPQLFAGEKVGFLQRRLRWFGADRQHSSLDAPRGHAFLTAAINVHQVSNAYWDGTSWYRYDESQPSALFILDNAGGLVRYTAAAGTGPIAWVSASIINPAGCLVYHSVNQSIANNSSAVPVFDSEVYDTDGFHAAGSSTLTVPANMDGVYTGVANMIYASTATGGRFLAAIGLNGTANLVGFEERANAAVSIIPRLSVVTPPLRLVAGDNLRLLLLQASGGPLNLTGGQYGATFGMIRHGGY